MRRFSRSTQAFVLVGLVLAIVFGLFTDPATAGRRLHRHHRPKATPSATPSVALRPLVLIAGGTGTVDAPTGESPAVLNTAEVYDYVAGGFLPINSITSARDHHVATIMSNGKVLIVGGIDTAFAASIPFMGAAVPSILSSTEVFDPSVGVFDVGPRMTVPRDEPTATLLGDGKVLIVGGAASSAEMFDPSTNKFVAAGEMTKSRYGQSATLLPDGQVLIAGGGSKKTEIYDPRAGKFRPSAKLRSNRIYHTATLLPDGTVLIAGGSPYARDAAVDTAEIYDEIRGAIKAGSRMTETRAGHTATLLSDGRVLIAGGHDDNSAELYDGRRFSRTSDMNFSRYSHTATLLPDGKVLIAGGWGSKNKPLASAEIYDPSCGRFTPTRDMTQRRAGQTATLIWVHWPVDWIKPTPTATPTETPTATQTSSPIRSGRASATRLATPARAASTAPSPGVERSRADETDAHNAVPSPREISGPSHSANPSPSTMIIPAARRK